MAFVAINKAPGVYIEEVQVPGPIPGVGTSTAAFIGPARQGPTTPTFLTNWTQFVEAFGVQDEFGPFFPTAPVAVAHAVRGFFDNGGATMFFVRVTNAARARLPLNDRAATPQATLVVKAKKEGTGGNFTTVQVQDASILITTALRADGALTAASTSNSVTVSNPDAAKFRPTDIVFLNGAGLADERATIASISGGTITFTNNLANPYAIGDTIRIANLDAGQTKFRVTSSTGIERGSYLHIAQGAVKEDAVVSSVDATNNFVTLEGGLANPYTMGAADAAVDVNTLEFKITVTPQSGSAEIFDKLSMDPRHSRYFAAVVSSANADVTLHDPPSSSPPPNNRPVVIPATVLVGGADEDVSQIDTNDYFNAIDALEKEDEVNILCIPDRTDQDVQQKMIDHCAKMQDRFAILDPSSNATPSQILAQRNLVNSTNGYAAFYYPRIIINNPVAAGRITVPPSGHLAGVYARTDTTRGVHKAPANESIAGVLDLERKVSDDEQGQLNESSVNVIRNFPGRGITVWGARTIAPKDRTQWRYINVRRLLLFIEESIQEGTQFAVFEPNNSGLWATVKRQVSDFLTRVWRDGALIGETADDAFSVRIDSELNPPSIVALGQLIIEVKLYPTTPAEFVVFRIIQEPGGPSVQE